MKKRIVKETLKNGDIQYRVEMHTVHNIMSRAQLGIADL